MERILAISALISDMWSLTGFSTPELDRYAEKQIRNDTRHGLQLVALLSVLAHSCIAISVLAGGPVNTILTTNVIVGALSVHILISAAFVHDVRTLHMLGIVFLVISALAITFLAHRLGDLSIGMIAAMVLLTVAIPLVPWGLREAIVVVLLTYLMLTSSLASVPDRFDPEALKVLQLLMLGAATVAIVITGRNTLIRKQDIRARFDLEHTSRRLELLSMQDHLTGAWNRRYLEDEFPRLVEHCHRKGHSLQIAVLDVDDFKGINDEFGHQIGDEILVEICRVFIEKLGDDGRLIRLGGDEFQILYCGDKLESLIDHAIGEIQRSSIAETLVDKRQITISAGLVSANPNNSIDMDALYKQADKALYAEKKTRRPAREGLVANPLLGRTGTWRI